MLRVIRPFFLIFTRSDWKGGDKFPKSGGFVIAVNHISQLDPLFMGHYLADQGVTPRFLAKDTIMNARGLKRILYSAEQIPVYRATEGAADSLRKAIEAVNEGKSVTLYPEGTITRDPQLWPMTGRTGAVRVAHVTNAPLIPVAQWGVQDILWPYTKRFRPLPRKTMHVRVGDPVDISWLGENPTEADYEKATDQLMDVLTQILSGIRGELPTGPRQDVRTLAKPKTTYDDERKAG